MVPRIRLQVALGTRLSFSACCRSVSRRPRRHLSRQTRAQTAASRLLRVEMRIGEPLSSTCLNRESPLYEPANGRPTAAPAPLGEPVITHPVPPPQQAVPTPPVASTPNSAAASPLPPPMPKSMFDFVSPFDAFERPTSRAQPPTGSGAATAPRSSASPVKPSNNLTPVGALSPAVGSPSLSSPAVGTPGLVSPALASPMPAQTPSGPSTPADLTHVRSHSPAIKQVQNVRTGSRRPSAASSPPGAKGKTDLGLPWLVTKVAKNVEGTG